MKINKKIKNDIIKGNSPIHLLSLSEVGKKAKITKTRKSKKYYTSDLQIGIIYKKTL